MAVKCVVWNQINYHLPYLSYNLSSDVVSSKSGPEATFWSIISHDRQMSANGTMDEQR